MNMPYLGHGVSVMKSWYVVFEFCDFSGNFNLFHIVPRRGGKGDKAQATKVFPMLYVLLTPEAPSRDDDARKLAQTFVCAITKVPGSCSNSTHPPALLISACYFTCGQECNEANMTSTLHRSFLLQTGSRKGALRGRALGIYLPLNTGILVNIHKTHFYNICSAVATTVLVKFYMLRRRDTRSEASLLVCSNCSFLESIGMMGGGATIRFPYQYGNTRGGQLTGPFVIVNNSEFAGNVALREGGGVAVIGWPAPAAEGHVRFVNVGFFDNIAGWNELHLPGGAISINGRGGRRPTTTQPRRTPSSRRPTRSSGAGKRRPSKCIGQALCIHFLNVNFADNSGFGSFRIGHATAVFSGTRFENNSESAIVADQARLIFSDSLLMVNNSGKYGGAFRLRKFSWADLTEVTNLTMELNTAQVQGSILHVDHETSATTLNRALLSNPTRDYLSYRCPFRFPRILDENPTAFAHILKASSGGTSAFFMSNLQTCGIRYRHLMSFLYDSPIENPRYCMPYAPAKWDMVNNETACDQYYCAVLEQYAHDGSCLEQCARQETPIPLRLNCSIDRRTLPDERVLSWTYPSCLENITNHFDELESNASAKSQTCQRYTPRSAAGKDTRTSPIVLNGICHGYNASVCERPNAYLHQPPNACYSQKQGLLIVNNFQKQRKPGAGAFPIASKPAWLIFESTSTACYKTVGDQVWYFGENCAQKDIFSRALQSPVELQLRTDCALLEMAETYSKRRSTLLPILPGYYHVLVPWASMLHNWDREDDDKKCSADTRGLLRGKATSISRITLNPAPGEMFSLQVTAYDQVLRMRGTALKVRVVSEYPVVMGHMSYLILPDLGQVFFSADPIQNISLYGPPGAIGSIELSVKGEITFKDLWDSFLSLTIPFRLRQCHQGFLKMDETNKTARELVNTFSSPSSSHNLTGIRKKIKSQMGCQCAKTFPCVKACSSRGKKAYISRNCWAGNSKEVRPIGKRPGSYGFDRTWFNLSIEEFSSNKTRYDPIGSYDQELNGFAAETCPLGLCSPQLSDHDVWVIGDHNPCASLCNCGGPLCTICKTGYRYTMNFISCVDCSKRFQVPIGVYFALSFAVQLVVFAILLFLNVGLTPSLDTWILFTQAFYCIHFDNNYSREIFHNIITFGLGRLCITEDIDALVRVLALVISPFYSLTILAVIYLAARRATRLQLLQRLQSRHSIRHVFWLVIIVSHCLMVQLAGSLLSCSKLNGKSVLNISADIQCFTGKHMGYVLLAIASLLVFVLPPPMLLIWRPTHIWPALTGFFDEAMHIYVPNKPWWASVNMLRRVVYTMALPIIRNSQHRRVFLCIYTGALLALHGYIRPFRRNARLWKFNDFDNTVEFVSLFSLLVLSVVRIVQLDMQFGSEHRNSLAPIIVYSLVSTLPLSVYVYRFVRSWRNVLGQKGREPLVVLWDESSEEGAFRLAQRRELAVRQADNAGSDSENLCTPTCSPSAADDIQGSGSSSNGQHIELRPSASGSSRSLKRSSDLREPLLMDEMVASTERSLREAAASPGHSLQSPLKRPSRKQEKQSRKAKWFSRYRKS
eukprot:scpid823/ scgid0960/ 